MNHGALFHGESFTLLQHRLDAERVRVAPRVPVAEVSVGDATCFGYLLARGVGGGLAEHAVGGFSVSLFD